MILLLLAAALPMVPDRAKTPGAWDSSLQYEQLCPHANTAARRHVTDRTKKNVFRMYNVDPKTSKFEVDHLVSLQLGGTNDIRNLWPQSYETQPWNAHKKDALETRLHTMICHRQISVIDAQRAISTDWIAAYKKYVAPY